ncbi:hypothetical protein FPZ12_009035 [Amycolatopsis acidicola]|uniref:Uncharacterized protein n=1 Tax=Amycolatopsis acidicola TaxID=2596893 RepID=A0A5N0VDG9_9PSEU|nr:hypothetical protein [Amycolatopsis acidicola]KAA9163638.1 hypothetical protein FPZ12_009035 [Amycolatopsis acidicola]
MVPRGSAADQAFQYFSSVATIVRGYADGLASLRDKYLEAAKGAWEFAEAANDLVQQIFDQVFWAALEAGAGAALSETVIAPAVLWSLAALQCSAIVRDWDSITKLLMQIQNAVRAVHGELARTRPLRKLKDNTGNPQLAELASELLAGNVTPRSVLESGLYGEALAPATDRLATWYSGLSESEKAEQSALAEDATRQLAAEQPPTPRPKRVLEEEYEDFSERDWLDG